MQISSSPPASAGSTNDGGAMPFSAVNAITTTHLTLIAVLAIIAVIGMIYGARLKRRRTLAQREEQQRLDDYDKEHEDAPATRTSADASAPSEPAALVSTAPLDASLAVPSPATRDDAAPLAGASDAPAAGSVTQLKGLGPKVAARLAELGFVSVGQIAALDDDGADALDAKLGAFQGRIARDRWVEQARFLAAGDRAGFEAVFGRL